MATKILMNVCDGEECRIAVIENGILQEYFVDRPSQLTHVGDVYRAVVTNVESAIQAAFVDLGYRKNAFLHVSDVISAYQKPIKLTDLYGHGPVEIIAVEDIDFSKAPDREIELDDDEDEGGSGRDFDDESEESEDHDPIEAPAIVAKSDFEQSRDEVAIQQTVQRERIAEEGSDQRPSESDNGDDRTTAEKAADAAAEANLSPEEIEERRKAEERRRKGLRRKLKLRDKLAANEQAPTKAKVEEAPTARATIPGFVPRPAVIGTPKLARATVAKIEAAAEGAPQKAPEVAAPAPDKAPAPAAPVIKLPPRPEPVGIPVESKASARFKVSMPVRAVTETPAEEAPKKAPPPPAHSLPINAPEVESKAAPRLKLSIPRRAAVPESEPVATNTDANTESDNESDNDSQPRDREGPVGTQPAEYHGLDGFGMGALSMSERSLSSVHAHKASILADSKRYRFMPQPKLQGLLHRGQEMLVQVTRAAQGGKGPSVTTYISLPGRYMVLMPNTSKCGVSRKIRDHKTRQDLRKALRRLRIPEGMGVIIRTAAAGRPIEELQRDLNYLLRIWNDILADVNSNRRAPSCSYRDSDPAVRTVRDYFTKDVSEIVIDDRAVYDRVVAFFDALMPDYRDRVRFYDGGVPLFAREGIEPQIEHIFDKKVPLPSGGYLFVEQTEALVAIDVNSGRFTSESSAEETAYKTNLEAVPEIVRQLRLRDLGGIVVGDFIDMMEARHRREVEERLKEELRKGRARIKVATTSPFGLIEMTRQRVRPSIRVYTYTECPTCKGFGHVMGAETQALRLIRAVRLVLASDEAHGCVVAAPADVLSYLHSHLRPHIQRVEARYGKTIAFEWDPTLTAEELKLWFINSRGDRAIYNLPGELNKLASSRQLAGFDTGGTGRRRRSGIRRGGRREGDPIDSDATKPAADDVTVERADVEIVDFDRRGERRTGERSRPFEQRNRDRRDDRRGQPGGRPDAVAPITPRPASARPADALDEYIEGEEREERADGQRGNRRRRGRDRDRPRPVGPFDPSKKVLVHGPQGANGSSNAAEPELDAEGNPMPATDAPRTVGEDQSAEGLARRRRGRRGGRRHRRPDGTLVNGDANDSDTNGPIQYGSIDDLASQENAVERKLTGEDTTDLRRSVLANVEYGDDPETPDVNTNNRRHVSVKAGASNTVSEDNLTKMQHHLTVVADAFQRGVLVESSVNRLKTVLQELTELADSVTGDDEAPSAELEAQLMDARQRLAGILQSIYVNLPRRLVAKHDEAESAERFAQAMDDLMTAMLSPAEEPSELADQADSDASEGAEKNSLDTPVETSDDSTDDDAIDMTSDEAADDAATPPKRAAKSLAKKAAKSLAKKAPASSAAKATPAKKTATKKALAKKAAAKKTATKKAPAKKTAAKKTATKKAPVKKTAAKKTATKKAAKK